MTYPEFEGDTPSEEAADLQNDARTCQPIGTILAQQRSWRVLGFTYFVRRADGLIKIGFSARPHRRPKELERQYGKLEVLAIVPSSIAGEFGTHQRFAEQRADGEWFRSSPELLSFIEDAKALAGNLPGVHRLRAAQQPAQIKPRFKIKVPQTLEQASKLRNWLEQIQHKTPRPAKNFVSNLIYQIKGTETQADLDRLQPFMAYQAQRLASVSLGNQ